MYTQKAFGLFPTNYTLLDELLTSSKLKPSVGWFEQEMLSPRPTVDDHVRFPFFGPLTRLLSVRRRHPSSQVATSQDQDRGYQCVPTENPDSTNLDERFIT